MSDLNISTNKIRPVIGNYQDPVLFLKEMLEYRKATERSFSVMKATQNLRKVSSALVTLVVQRKRKMTLDRADEFAKLMDLTAPEKLYFKNWLQYEGKSEDQKEQIKDNKRKHKKEFSVNLLNDWLNVYVKDSFRLASVRKNPQLIYKELGAIASKSRIEKSIQFLLKEGYLRKTLDGQIVIETLLAASETPTPGHKVRSFHKAALSIAKQNMDLFAVSERFANTLILDLTPERYQELIQIIQEFAKELQEFASVEHDYGDKLYQVIINLSPTGGRVE